MQTRKTTPADVAGIDVSPIEVAPWILLRAFSSLLTIA